MQTSWTDLYRSTKSGQVPIFSFIFLETWWLVILTQYLWLASSMLQQEPLLCFDRHKRPMKLTVTSLFKQFPPLDITPPFVSRNHWRLISSVTVEAMRNWLIANIDLENIPCVPALWNLYYLIFIPHVFTEQSIIQGRRDVLQHHIIPWIWL